MMAILYMQIVLHVFQFHKKRKEKDRIGHISEQRVKTLWWLLYYCTYIYDWFFFIKHPQALLWWLNWFEFITFTSILLDGNGPGIPGMIELFYIFIQL